MIQSMFVVIAVPVALGQLARMIPEIARRATEWKIPIGILNRCLILTVVLSAAVKAGTRCRATPIPPALLLILIAACLGIHLATWITGWFSTRLCFRLSRETAIAVSFSSSQKTLPVGLYVASQFFPQLGLASLPMLVYHVTQLVCDTWIASSLANGSQQNKPHE
jgi:predicted Na+-dependent transporter